MERHRGDPSRLRAAERSASSPVNGQRSLSLSGQAYIAFAWRGLSPSSTPGEAELSPWRHAYHHPPLIGVQTIGSSASVAVRARRPLPEAQSAEVSTEVTDVLTRFPQAPRRQRLQSVS